MELSSVHPYPSTAAQVTALFCLFWPILVAGLLRKREISAAPMAAMAAPLAFSLASVFDGLCNVMRGMAISGSGGRASVAAGAADALFMLATGTVSAVVVLIIALLRRHRPFLDRMTVFLFAVVLLGVIEAIVLVNWLGSGPPQSWHFHLAVATTVLARLVAIAALVWSFLAGLGRITSRPIPYGVTAIASLWVIGGVIVWQIIQHHRDIAMHGWR
jgi:hypothetical protein